MFPSISSAEAEDGTTLVPTIIMGTAIDRGMTRLIRSLRFCRHQDAAVAKAFADENSKLEIEIALSAHVRALSAFMRRQATLKRARTPGLLLKHRSMNVKRSSRVRSALVGSTNPEYTGIVARVRNSNQFNGY